MVTNMTKALALVLGMLMAAPAVAAPSDYVSKPRVHFTEALFHRLPQKKKKAKANKPKSNFVSKVLNLNHGFFRTLYQSGIASWYGSPDWMTVRDGFNHARTASGVRFDTYQPWCAHRYLPFQTHILIKNMWNGKTTECIIVDRGPFNSRVLDMSYAVKTALGVGGYAPVAIYVQ